MGVGCRPKSQVPRGFSEEPGHEDGGPSVTWKPFGQWDESELSMWTMVKYLI